MKERRKNLLWGLALMVLFALLTLLIQSVDVQLAGQTRTEVGFAALNQWFHDLTGVHLMLYTLTDWLGLVPVFVCLIFAAVGLGQLIKRKSLLKVDRDILWLGGYYLLVIAAYLVFEMFPVNYRPILIEGRLEASYPSSTTLLVLSVMPTLAFQARRRVKNAQAQKAICGFAVAFSVLMVLGRMLSGVHWLTDIAGAALFSVGLFCMYRAAVV